MCTNRQYIEVERAKADLRLTRSSLDSITRSPSRAPPSGAPSSRPPRTIPMAPACSPAKMSRRVATLTLISKNIHHHSIARRPLWGHQLRGASRVVTEILSVKAAGQHAYNDPQSDADTNNHDFINSSVQCVVLGNVHRQSLVRIDL